MTIPMAISYLLPIGVKGAFCAVLIMGIFGGDSTHLHSWGSMFVQDVLVPLRKRPFGPKQHIRALRLSIFGVALFVFIFGALFPQTEFIVMWFAVTMAIYVGGAGAVIIGGLYWKKGTTAGAWSALMSGSGLSVGGIILRTVYKDAFPLNGMQVSFGATLVAISVYVIVSLLTCKEDFDMQRMLHRGKYAKVSEGVGEHLAGHPNKDRGWFSRLVGIDENFTRGDKLIAWGLMGWGMVWFAVFVVGTLWNLIRPWPNDVWKHFWQIVGVGIPVFMSFVTAIWFTWGGSRDIFRLFRLLKAQQVNELDDGTVVGHQNLDEAAITHALDGDKNVEGPKRDANFIDR
jgi:SSS family solute:Na+ symporter